MNRLFPETTLIFEFKPNTGGVHHAVYEAILSDGTKISLPLEGVGKDAPSLFLSILLYCLRLIVFTFVLRVWEIKFLSL